MLVLLVLLILLVILLLVQETDRFRTHMLERLTKKKEHFGDSVGEVVDVCTEVRTIPL